MTQRNPSFTPGEAPECMACPIGLTFFALREVRPEVADHLMKAGMELFLAFRAFMDAAEERMERRSPLERINID
ncbi:MAG: hypothetical protein ACLGH3_09295 [Actinomycetota bacterium]